MELADMIRALRRELSTAMVQGAGEAIRFELGPVEVEATVAVQQEAGANGKVRFWVVEAGTEGKYAKAQTQRITLTLQPQTLASDGTPVSARIAGATADGER
ncbi:hypothetical protein P8605_06400 [Streptomyces sp. T-3]|nr:hypothetical protein [Streptomyces sp. T-3]